MRLMPFPRLTLRRTTALLTWLSLATSTTACAVYTPLDRDGARARAEARIDLTERGTLELSPRIGVAVASVDGRVTTVTDSTLIVALVQTVTRNGDTQQWQGEPLVIPLGYISGYRQRQPSTARSLLLGGGILLGVLGAGAAFGIGNSGSGGNTGGGGTSK